MKLKICGMKYPENILKVAALQPDYLGFIFYGKSKRFVADFPKTDIPSSIKKVGVFVDEDIDEVLKKARVYKLDYVQLHGNESVLYCNVLKQKNVKIIKVFSVGLNFDFNVLNPFDEIVDYFLFDTKGKERGGNGIVFDWRLLKNYPSQKPYFLSGGIGLETTDNLKQFFSESASKYCHALDVNSQFEDAPALKNTETLKEFKNRLL